MDGYRLNDIVFAIKAEKQNQEVFDILNKYNFEFMDMKAAQVFSNILMICTTTHANGQIAE